MAFEFVEVKLLRAICRFLPYVIASTVRCAAIRFSFKGFTDSFALITLAVPKSCYSLGARTTFDRVASFCSLFPAPQALATSLAMTRVWGKTDCRAPIGGLACRLGRCFCFAEVSTGHPHRNDENGENGLPQPFIRLRNDKTVCHSE